MVRPLLRTKRTVDKFPNQYVRRFLSRTNRSKLIAPCCISKKDCAVNCYARNHADEFNDRLLSCTYCILQLMHGNNANNAQNCTKRSEFMFVGVRNSEESRAKTAKLVIFQRPFIHFSHASCVSSVQYLCSAFFECFLITSFWQTSQISFNDAHCMLILCGND